MGASFSVIIPVLHEEAAIGGAVERIRALARAHATEIIVVDGDPDGGTLRVIPDGVVRKVLSARGRGSQLNRGANAASGEILLFHHADTILPPDAFDRIAKLLSDRAIAGGAFDLRIDSPHPVFRLIERVASLRSRLTRIPYGDQAIFLRRDCFRILGGFREIPLMEDVDLMRRLRKSGRGRAQAPSQARRRPGNTDAAKAWKNWPRPWASRRSNGKASGRSCSSGTRK